MGYKESSIINPFLYIAKQIRRFYLNSSIYNTKISKVFDGGFEYIPQLKIFITFVIEIIAICYPRNNSF